MKKFWRKSAVLNSGDNPPKMTILVVDDEKDICDIIRNFLLASKYVAKIITADSALQGHQKMQNQEFDLVIADYMMQGKDGIHFIQDLKKTMKYQSTKYLLISGALRQEHILMAIRAKISDILVKPFGRKELLNKIYQMFKLSPEKSLMEGNLGDKVEEDWNYDSSWDVDLDID